jgi:predicted house-cleaning noncanonical NTP pyrophosphatase (MazG superfamily)
MTVKRFRFDKLIRDKLLDRIKQQGATPCYDVLDDAVYLRELKAKLVEEAKEASEETDPEKLIEELGDVYEVIAAILKALNSSFDHLLIWLH